VVFVRADPAGADHAGADPAGAGVVDMTPAGVSIRSRVHEYGGGASCLVPGHGPGTFAYVDGSDEGVWLYRGGDDAPVALSGPPPPGARWAHGGLGASADGNWVVAVREVHADGAGGDGAGGDGAGGDDQGDGARPRRSIVAFGARPENAGESVLAEGHDFYGAPRLDTTAQRLAMAVWDHPDMQWDRSAMVVTPLEVSVEPETGRSRLAPAGPPWNVECGEDVSVGQPVWQRDGSLRFVSDRLGWWQPSVHAGVPDGQPAVALTAVEAEFSGPDWALGQSTMAELPDGRVVARMTSGGRDALVVIGSTAQTQLSRQPLRPVPQPCVAISGLCAHKDGVAYIGAPPDGPVSVWMLTPTTPTTPTTPITPTTPTTPDTPTTSAQLRPRAPSPLTAADIAAGEPFSFEGRTGRRIHGLLYRPTLAGTAGPPDALPPLVVACHSGPTGSVGAGFDVVVQYFTSRGFALAAVDYAGSTGYGREYRCSLWGQWGVLDSQDCADAARFLAATHVVDRVRMAVRGTSSGGLTALNALADGEVFAAAASWYGVSDLCALAASTHDFEAHYLDRLVGPLPEFQETYEARSPVDRADEISGAVLLLQGQDDRVVPPAQSERLRNALLARGRPCTVRFFEGEGHGFRRAETLEACLEEELDFYRRRLDL
jgi:dienelactone hydrolase